MGTKRGGEGTPQLSFVGRSNVDCLIPNPAVQFCANSVIVDLPGASFTISTQQRPFSGGKFVADLPSAPPKSTRVDGGGALNTAACYRRLSLEPARFLDTVAPDESLIQRMASICMDARYLGLYPRPGNWVIGTNGNRTILKPPASNVESLSEQHERYIAWACDATFVVVNSIGEPAVMRHVLKASAKSGARLLAMVTPALPGALIANEVIPAAQAVFAAYDEIPRLLGEGFDSTPLGALRALRHIRGLAPRAAAFITLGKDGVLASAPGGCECHIALCPGPSAAIQACVALDPARTNGAGDAFLAGAAAFYAEGASLVEGITQSSSNPTVAAGISACAAAVRWMGYQPTLTAGDFQTVDLTGERTPIAA